MGSEQPREFPALIRAAAKRSPAEHGKGFRPQTPRCIWLRNNSAFMGTMAEEKALEGEDVDAQGVEDVGASEEAPFDYILSEVQMHDAL